MRAPESGRRRGPAATGASVDQKARRCPWLCYDAAMTVPQPAMRKRLATMLMKAVNLALPPRCLGCGLIVEQDDSLCVACWSGLSFIRAPRCAACGVPFETDLGEVALCARSEEHTSELQSLMRISYAVFCLKKKTRKLIQRSHTNKHKNNQLSVKQTIQAVLR